jgi:hypothetical protein
VFFTAGVTAMLGVLVLGHYDLLDLELIYVNPTFLRSALTGGVIMGAGFIIGGFCPGTSVCALSIGKMDAMLFVVGSIFGVFAFVETFPMIENFYLADAMGPVRMNEQLGMSMEVFALVLSLVAIAAFYLTWQIEKRVRGKQQLPTPKIWVSRYAIASLAPFIAVALLFLLPSRQEIIAERIAEAKRQQKCVFHEINADKLAHEIVNHYYELNIIDVRSPEEFASYHLPMAINIPFDEITERKWESIFRQKMKTNVFYAENDTLVKMACLKAKYVGNSKNLVLKESATQFKNMFETIEQPDMATASKREINIYNFRSKANREMQELTETLKNIGKPVTKEVKVAAGGC